MNEKFIEDVQKWHALGYKIVFTNGCFDIIHVGHVKLLEFASKLGDILVVGINSDQSIRRLKGNSRPINKLEDRIEVVRAIKGVNEVIAFPVESAGVEDTPLDLIKTIRPHFLVKGGDYNESEVVGHDFVNSCGGETVIFPLIYGKSTSSIVRLINHSPELK